MYIKLIIVKAKGFFESVVHFSLLCVWQFAVIVNNDG